MKKPKIITWREFPFDGITYFITVRMYDEELGYVAADWKGDLPEHHGELGYGIPDCENAISLAEQAIVNPQKNLAERLAFRRETTQP